ncbi:hypothetical protein B0H13DRAFT_1919287 [Mycena leptocephala]|nr:hypothetical protein B0H13DRAFT_1919287 [Mycena leptocephala]
MINSLFHPGFFSIYSLTPAVPGLKPTKVRARVPSVAFVISNHPGWDSEASSTRGYQKYRRCPALVTKARASQLPESVNYTISKTPAILPLPPSPRRDPSISRPHSPRSVAVSIHTQTLPLGQKHVLWTDGDLYLHSDRKSDPTGAAKVLLEASERDLIQSVIPHMRIRATGPRVRAPLATERAARRSVGKTAGRGPRKEGQGSWGQKAEKRKT